MKTGLTFLFVISLVILSLGIKVLGANPSSMEEIHARDLLEDLACSIKLSRTRCGYLSLTGGSLLLGLSLLDSKERDEGAIIQRSLGIIGALGISAGAFLLQRPWKTEREYVSIMAIEDPREKEEASYALLLEQAHRRKRMRMIAGTLLAFMAVGPLREALTFIPGDGMENRILFFRALSSIGLSSFFFFRQSPVERKVEILDKRGDSFN